MEQTIDVAPAPKPAPKLNFDTIEQVRKSMLLTMQNMAELMGVSRVTYYNWVKGKPLRHVNAVKAKAVLRQLATVVNLHNWPTPAVQHASRKERFEMLMNAIKELDSEPVTK